MKSACPSSAIGAAGGYFCKRGIKNKSAVAQDFPLGSSVREVRGEGGAGQAESIA